MCVNQVEIGTTTGHCQMLTETVIFHLDMLQQMRMRLPGINPKLRNQSRKVGQGAETDWDAEFTREIWEPNTIQSRMDMSLTSLQPELTKRNSSHRQAKFKVIMDITRLNKI